MKPKHTGLLEQASWGKSMKHKNTVVTLALVGVLALAALAGGLLPSGSPVHAADPTFALVSDTNCAGDRCIPENTPPGVNIGDPVSATDDDEGAIEYGQTLTYSLGGTDAASFDIDPSTGQLITKAPLDEETKNSYTVTVSVDDGETRETALTPQSVTITVTDVPEPPAAPAAPAVVSGAADASTTSLKVVWHVPDNAGKPIAEYEVEYKKTTGLAFFGEVSPDNPDTTGTEAISHSGVATTATITGLEADTSYHVRVRATSPESQSGGVEIAPWSLVGTGSTNKENNSPPTFGTSEATRNVFENTAAGEDVGAPVTANDNDATTLTYVLDGPDKDSFSFDTASGQIRTKSPLNHEDPGCGYVSTAGTPTCTYRVTVTVTDGAGGSDATAVNIMVGDRHEPVLAPARPTVRPTEDWSTRLDISWNAPTNTGPPITSYALRYRQDSTGSFLNDNCGSADSADSCDNITGTKTTIFGLTAGKSHQVQVLTILAGTPARRSVWSDSGTGNTNAANKEPRFDDRPSSGTGSMREPPADATSFPTYTITRNVDENTRAGQPVGRAVRAEDGDGHSRTYRLQASADTDPARTQAAKFDIDKTTGQIRTKSPLNHEDSECGYVAGNELTDPPTATTCTYTVQVQVWDGFNTHKVEEDSESPTVDDAILVAITVRDKEETPGVPTVMVTSPSGNTTLVVTWDAPANTGPTNITYDVQYRKGSGAFSNDNCEDADADDNCDGLTNTTTTIQQLEADTSYSVQVRARNAEGPSAWSRLATVKTNKGANAPPAFATASTTFTVPENTPSGQLVGAAVTADDGDSASWSYSLGGADAASFNFNTRTAEITTRSSLDFEEKQSYSVRVRASDGNDGGSASHPVTITVTNVNEAPIPPAAPRVTATQNSGWSLDVTWTEPRNAGKPSIIDYDIQYRKLGDTTWQTWPHGADAADTPTAETGDTDRSAKITTILSDPTDDTTGAHLEPRTQYEVEVRATNAEGTSDWSPIGRGTTGAGNSRPIFDRTETLVTLSVDENTRSGQNVGSAISATDADGNRLTYRLEGPSKDSFTIISSSGQIRTKSPLDYESRSSYSVTVEVDDNSRRSNSGAAKSVTITVDDVDEIPPAPPAPMVAGIPGSTNSVRAAWNAPAYAGPPITDYEVRWGVAGSGGWNTLVGRTGADRSQIITGLTAGTRYNVQVRAKSAEGTSDWSRSGTGTPNPDVANRPPTFSGSTRTFSIAENTGPGVDVGDLVEATDRDGDTLTYTLEGTDADSFSILSTGTGGQIQTSAALNHEEKSSYSVTVRVSDGRGGTDAVNVRITVTDVNGEAPDTPAVPTVTAVSSTSLSVSWDAPDNSGPPITDYDYRYREPGQSWTEVTATTITATTVTIDGLTPSTYYDVEVRATNAEGTSGWSNSGTGQTNAPGANNPPVFTEGTSATRSVSATSPSGTNIGLPVAATDADSGDTVTYSLEGTDAASFDIVVTSGQIQTIAGVTLTVGQTYTVTVVADDTKDTTRITVSIEATAAPPNNPPVFSEGPSTTRSVREDAATGTNVGSPVTATDVDTGDTRTYALEGTDAASFSIVASSGQIRTLAALDASTKSTYSVTVRARDSRGGTDTIDVTITVTARPATFGCATLGAVSDTSNVGLVADCEALLAARNALEGNARLNWTVGSSISNWEGVAITGTPPRVTRVVLRARGLSGTVPADLGSLPMLTELNLRANDLTGSIPAELGRLSRLEKLLLHDNELSGTIPNLSGLRSLKMLWLSGKEMSLTGPVPSWLNRMSGLESVSMWGNDLSGPIPNLTGMTSLSLLKLQSNNLTGGVPAWLGQMQSLRGLYIHANPLGGTIPRELGQLTRLRRIWLHSSQLTGTIPPELANMANLATLNLRNNQLTGGIPSELGRMSELEQLLLHTNQLTGDIPSVLGNLSKLKQLWLSENRLTGGIPAQLGSLPRLTQLNLHTNDLSGAIPSQLGDLGDTLTRLRLGAAEGSRGTRD